MVAVERRAAGAKRGGELGVEGSQIRLGQPVQRGRAHRGVRRPGIRSRRPGATGSTWTPHATAPGGTARPHARTGSKLPRSAHACPEHNGCTLEESSRRGLAWNGSDAMFERFTDQSRRAVVLAQDEARFFNHNYIGTEHLLAGLRRENRGVAARTLESADITMDAVRAEIEKLVGRGDQAPSGHIPFTPRAKKCLELSLREALNLGHNHIGTGHLLLGLISKDDCEAVQVLGGLGADLGNSALRPSRKWRMTRKIAAAFLLRGAPNRPMRFRPCWTRSMSGSARSSGSSASRGQRCRGHRVRGRSPQADHLQADGFQPIACRAKVARLRALLRERGIDPGDPRDAGAACGSRCRPRRM